MCFSSQFTDHRCAIGLPPPSGGRNSIPVSPLCANRSLPLSIVKMESACETKPSPTVVKLKPIEAPPETFRFEQVPQSEAIGVAPQHATLFEDFRTSQPANLGIADCEAGKWGCVVEVEPFEAEIRVPA
nr:uncharacterized protein LOC109190215 isoform X1 [Ipomoea batatas]